MGSAGNFWPSLPDNAQYVNHTIHSLEKITILGPSMCQTLNVVLGMPVENKLDTASALIELTDKMGQWMMC